jgi:hypothetical protein
MPTGYTHAVQEGKITTLREFAMTCARAFGACIMMRDDPGDKPIPESFEPETDYHDKAIAEAQETLAEVAALSDAECDQRAKAAFDAALTSHTERETRRAREKGRYEEMIGKVERWHVPDDISGLRDFMLDQLRKSVEFDCSPPRYNDAPTRLTGAAWRDSTLAEASRSLAYHQVERQKEIDRVASRNAWLKALRDSIPAPEPRGFV